MTKTTAMTLVLIVALLLVGLLLISTEVFLVPGTTIVGGIGLIVVGIGVFYGFQKYGWETGATLLAGSGILVAMLTVVGIRRLSTGKFNVDARIDGKVNAFDYSHIREGDEGVTLSALRPEGRAMINDDRVIVYSKGFYIDTDVEITVVRIKDNKIFVEPKS